MNMRAFRFLWLVSLLFCAALWVPAEAAAPDSRENHGHALVGIGHDSVLHAGESADSVVSIAGSSSSEGDTRSVVSILGDTHAAGTVSGSAVAVLGNTYVDGRIGGSAVAVVGNVELGPHAEIGGDVVSIGGEVVRDPAAIVHGSVQNVLGGKFGGMMWLRTWVQHCLLYGRPLALVAGLDWAWGLALAFLLLYVCLALGFRDGLTQCVRTVEAQPGRTVLAALITMLLTPVLVVLLCVTVVGIPAVPFVVLGLFCAGLFGKAVMLAVIGRRIIGTRATGAVNQPATAVLIGGVLVLLLYVVPVLGFVVYKLLGILGLGAIAYTLLLAVQAREAVIQPAAPPDAAADSGTAAPATAAPADAGSGTTAPQTPPAGESPAAASQTAGSQTAGSQTAGSQAAASHAAAAVSASLPHAGFWIRMGALLLDVLLIGFATHLLHGFGHLHLIVLAAYGAIMWKARGATVGGIVFDLQVVRLDGRPIDWETAIVRALGCFLSLAVVGLGFFWIAFDPAHQAWHDKIAGTVVVRVNRQRVAPAG